MEVNSPHTEHKTSELRFVNIVNEEWQKYFLFFKFVPKPNSVNHFKLGLIIKMIKTLTLGSNISVSISISMKIYEKRLLIDPDIGQ